MQKASPRRTCVVIPCYNERERLGVAQIHQLINDEQVSVLLVDDGSTDGTGELIEEWVAAAPDRLHLLTLASNRGKAEAVRAGLQFGLSSGASAVGYLDADFSTPAEEMLRLVHTLEQGIDVALGSRVRLLGKDIERSLVRHYLGRVFATGASNALDLPVYDTQCGAKMFRATERLAFVLEQPFVSRWAFDVELLGRLIGPRGEGKAVTRSGIVEIPLNRWSDKAGSKLGFRAMCVAGLDLCRIAWELRRS